MAEADATTIAKTCRKMRLTKEQADELMPQVKKCLREGKYIIINNWINITATYIIYLHSTGTLRAFQKKEDMKLNEFTSPIWDWFLFIFDANMGRVPHFYECKRCKELFYCVAGGGKGRMQRHKCYKEYYENSVGLPIFFCI